MSVSWASSEAVSVLIFLLPGFVAAGVFDSLISNPKPSGIDVQSEPLFLQLLCTFLRD